jgi:hypothetical protein
MIKINSQIERELINMEGKFNNVLYKLQCDLATAKEIVRFPQITSDVPTSLALPLLIEISEDHQKLVAEIEEAIDILKREQEKAVQSNSV